jgi:glycosidase
MHSAAAPLSKALVAAFLLALAACGGGGSGGGAATPTPTPQPTPVPPVVLPTVDVSAVAAADAGSPLPAGWDKGAFMEIFVRSYQDSDGDGYGDLKGLISRLDYLQALGVKGLWLMPVTASQDHDHGYAVADYRAVEAPYGTLADFDELIKQAHARGIGVIVDYVMNHSAAQNPLFVNSSDAAANPYRNWYLWQNPAPAGWSIYGTNPWRVAASGSYFAAFDVTMPDWNLTLPAVVGYHQDNQRFWLNRGADGFRFDAVGNLVENGPTAWLDQPQNYTLMAQMQALAAGYQRRTIVCEAPDDPQGFGKAGACGSAFAFDLSASIVSAARGNPVAIQTVSNYFRTAPLGMSTMISNHDSFAGQRLWDQVGGNPAQYRLAAATYLLLPGRPFIYYGEEVGMSGAAALVGDAALRSPMSWAGDASRGGFTTGLPYRALAGNVTTQNAAAAAADPNSLLAFYKAMLALRNGLPSIAQGTYEQPFVSGSVMGYQRAFGGERIVVLVNYGGSDATASVAALPASASLLSQYPAGAAGAAVSAAGVASVTVPAQSLRVLKVGP